MTASTVLVMIQTTYMIQIGPKSMPTLQFQRLRHGEPSS
jgi:hypothetical protein